jgi:5' nucleotidase family
MNFVVGPEWRDQWDVVITSAGKPAFYTENNRPFREVDIVTGKAKFKQVRRMQKDNVSVVCVLTCISTNNCSSRFSN